VSLGTKAAGRNRDACRWTSIRDGGTPEPCDDDLTSLALVALVSVLLAAGGYPTYRERI